MLGRSAAGVIVLAVAAAGLGVWYYEYRTIPRAAVAAGEVVGSEWLEHLHSQNPKVAEEAVRQLHGLGADALPEIQAALRDPGSDAATTKAALKAAGLLGPVAAPAVADVSAHLANPEFTEESAVALSFLGRDAYGPLKQGATSDDPVVRRESLRSLGKLRERAPLDARAVVPQLLEALSDPDPGVRVVAATYLGIIHEDGEASVPALIETLQDEAPEVRSAAATALGSFGQYADTVIPALRKAAGDRHEDVSREAGLAIVKLQSSVRK